jgi:hypothetical protein
MVATTTNGNPTIRIDALYSADRWIAKAVPYTFIPYSRGTLDAQDTINNRKLHSFLRGHW